MSEPQTLEFMLEGELPSKKNGWKPRKGGGMYIPKDLQTDIDALLWQIKGMRHKWPVPLKGSLSVNAEIVTRTKKQDTDNRYTTLQDILQLAGIIENDNDVDDMHCRRIVSKTSQPRITVFITYAA